MGFAEGSPEKRMSEMPEFRSSQERREILEAALKSLMRDDEDGSGGVKVPAIVPRKPPENSGSMALEIPADV